MPQLVRIAYHVQRSNRIPVDFERTRLHGTSRAVDDDSGEPVDGGKAQREVVAPALAGRTHQEPRGAVFSFEDVQRGQYLAAPVCDHTHIAREKLRQRIQISGPGRGHERGHELRMLRLDLTGSRRWCVRAARPYRTYVTACAGRKLPAGRFAPLQRAGDFAEREIEDVVEQECGALEWRQAIERQQQRNREIFGQLGTAV